MRASEFIAYSGDATKGTLCLEGKLSSRLKLIGSTLPASVVSCDDHHEAITIAPEKGKAGLVALASGHLIKGSWSHNCYLLEVRWELEDGKRPSVDLKQVWQPSADRLGGIVSYDNNQYHCIQVMIDSDWFTSNRRMQGKPGYRYVPDPNLLCRYLIGEVDKETVIAAASEQAEEETARDQLKRLQEDLRVAHGSCTLLEEQMGNQRKVLWNWLIELHVAVNSSWRVRQQRIRQVLNEFPIKPEGSK
ncbi:MAG: hypothetical protein PHH01_03475 [Patescibacteria group bacterium]|nr:hypothetical protein [Patescibacteria group bacterium]